MLEFTLYPHCVPLRQVIFITEYMSSGSLKQFLKKTKKNHKTMNEKVKKHSNRTDESDRRMKRSRVQICVLSPDFPPFFLTLSPLGLEAVVYSDTIGFKVSHLPRNVPTA